MTTPNTPAPKPSPISLRERKKARTRAQIQREALRLFHEHGYDATTIEQVAEAAEVAPSTVFRYFPTKPDLGVLTDHQHFLLHILDSLPPGLAPLDAIRAGFRAALASLTPKELAERRERERLILAIPELWTANLRNAHDIIHTIRNQLADRSQQPTDAPAIRALSGAIIGIVVTVWLDWLNDSSINLADTLDQTLAQLTF